VASKNAPVLREVFEHHGGSFTWPLPVQLFTPPTECMLKKPTTSDSLKMGLPLASLKDWKNFMLAEKLVVLLRLFRVRLTCPLRQPGVLLMVHMMSGHLPFTRPYLSSTGMAPSVPGLAAKLNLWSDVIAMSTV